MGWLALDTRVQGHSAISWVEEGQVETIHVEGKAARALEVLARLKDQHSGSVEGILVAAGPGTFSSIRTGVLYANLCARLLEVPLLELTEEEANAADFSPIIQAHLRGERASSPYVTPLYDREPNITIPRQQA